MSTPIPAALLRPTAALLLLSAVAQGQTYPTELGETVVLEAPSATPGDFAASALAQVGEWLLVGVPGADSGTGRVDLYQELADEWIGPTALLSPAPGSGHRFGRALAWDDDTLVVGEPQGSFPPVGPGRAHVYVLDGGSWTFQATLTADDGVYGDQFGRAVAVDGDRVVVGAPYDDEGALQTGAAYVFDRSGTSWNQTARLLADSPEAGSQFGRAVAVDADTVLVGAWLANTSGADSGTAFVFVDEGGGAFSQQAQLIGEEGSDGDHMGEAVVLIDDIALVGAPGADDIFEAAGDVRRFDRSGGVWTEGSFPAPFSITIGDRYGTALDYRDGLLVVGSPDVGSTPIESVFLFSEEDGVFTEEAVVETIGAAGDGFGRSVAVGSEAILGGAPDTDGATGLVQVTPLVTVGFFDDLGQALPGTDGEPVLTGTGTLIGLTPYSFDLSNALAGATSLLIVGASRIDAPFKQGVLVPKNDFILNIPVGGDGTASVGDEFWPNDPPGGFSIFLQWWIFDPGAVEGFAASNALEAFVPPF